MSDSVQPQAFAYVLSVVTGARFLTALRRIDALARLHYSGEMLGRIEDAIALRTSQLQRAMVVRSLPRRSSGEENTGLDDLLKATGRRSYDVFLKMIPSAGSIAELEDIHALASAQYAGRTIDDVEVAIAKRAIELSLPPA